MTITFRVLVVATIALLLQGGTNATSSPMSFYEKSKYRGGCIKCEVTKYQQCYQLDMEGLGGASSVWYHNKDTFQERFSLTFYTGKKCGGDWFRESLSFNDLAGISDFRNYTDKIQSFKVADFLTSNTTGRGYPSDATALKICRKVSDKECRKP
ncbi:hypothetical protein BGX26_011151 [Mortierella sp. AD094]|nr:hypothetical protein BGX26_011151 [Mortierella sp. AD094]